MTKAMEFCLILGFSVNLGILYEKDAWNGGKKYANYPYSFPLPCAIWHASALAAGGSCSCRQLPGISCVQRNECCGTLKTFAEPGARRCSENPYSYQGGWWLSSRIVPEDFHPFFHDTIAKRNSRGRSSGR